MSSVALRLARQPPDRLAAHDVLLEIERRRRLGPDDERRAARERLRASSRCSVDDRVAQRRIPLVLLRRCCPARTATRTRLARASASDPSRDARSVPSTPTPRRAAATHRRDAPSAARPRSTITQRDRGRRQREQRREAVDARHARELRDRQHRHLAVAEQRPREAVPDVLPPELGRDPDAARRSSARPCAERSSQPRHDQRERRGKERRDTRRAAPAANTASGVGSPPNVVIVSTSQ